MKDEILQSTQRPIEYNGKVLIFDGDIGNLARLSQRFERHGFDVHTCMSFERVLRSIEKEAFDLALVDQGSSIFEGRQVIRHLIRYNPAAPFIVMASRKDLQCYWEARALGALDYLEKPLSIGDTNWIVHYYLESLVTRSEKYP